MAEFIRTTATKKIFELDKRIQGISGGTSASKTISILMKLIDLSMTDDPTDPKLTSVVSESMPHLKRGAIRDFLSILISTAVFKEERWNKTDFIYTFETGSKIEFFSADMPAKTRGPRRDRLFINEGNNIKWESADQMIVRTRELVVIDWNPTGPFWWHEEIEPHRDHDFLIVTYKDNEALDPEIVKDIEDHKHNLNWWRVYGLGLMGEPEGLIYSGWDVSLADIPHEARLERRGLDFGFSNDEAALVDVYRWNGAFIFDEQFYRRRYHNREMATYIQNLEEPNCLVIGDAAEPKSIDEIKSYGINILPASKGPGSVTRGIDFIQDQRVFVTTRSVNLIKEYRSYMWMTDKDGKQLRVPQDGNDHALDAVRYAMDSIAPDPDDDKVWSTGNVDALIY